MVAALDLRQLFIVEEIEQKHFGTNHGTMETHLREQIQEDREPFFQQYRIGYGDEGVVEIDPKQTSVDPRIYPRSMKADVIMVASLGPGRVVAVAVEWSGQKGDRSLPELLLPVSDGQRDLAGGDELDPVE